MTRRVDGESYELFVPEHLPRGVPVPLIVMFHGLGSNGARMAANSGWVRLRVEPSGDPRVPDGARTSVGIHAQLA